MTPMLKPARSFGDIMMDGNPGSTLTGLIPHTVIVDDPFDYVVPTAGVLVKVPDLAKRGPRYVGIKTKKMSGVKGLR